MEKAYFPLKFLCGQLGVSRSGFYAWQKRPVSARASEDQSLLEHIRNVFTEHKGRYGSLRITNDLRKKGMPVGRNRVARLMREHSLIAKRHKRHVKTTDSNHKQPVADNLLARDFKTTAPNQKWLTDMTYIATLSGWLYLVVILDLFSRRVVGWSMSHHKGSEMACSALQMAVNNREPPKGLLHHSDRGSEFASHNYQEAIRRCAMVCSMSRKGNCWDNAPMESFFGTMKSELQELATPQSSTKAQVLIFEYLEGYYNRRRSHSSLGYISPVEYEQQFMQRNASIAA
jgi:putative transposase